MELTSSLLQAIDRKCWNKKLHLRWMQHLRCYKWDQMDGSQKYDNVAAHTSGTERYLQTTGQNPLFLDSFGGHIINKPHFLGRQYPEKEEQISIIKLGLTWPWTSVSTDTGSLKCSCHSFITWWWDYHCTRAFWLITSLMRAFKGSPCAEITSALDPYATVLKVGNQNLWEFHFEEKSMHLAAG